jgi:hypothetical protein
VTRTLRTHRRLRRAIILMVVVGLVTAASGTLAIATNAAGIGDKWISALNRVERFLAGPVPDRPTAATVLVTEPPATPSPEPSPSPTLVQSGGADPMRSIPPTPSPTPEPVPKKTTVNLLDDPEAVFTSQATKDWCAPAGVQMVLTIHGRIDPGEKAQREIAGRIREWESKQDSRNGDWGPAAMANALEAYGVPGYEVRAFETRQAALRDSARAIQKTGAPVILLSWWGAHTWVMTGFKSNADPTIFRDAKITGAYILDPWYPRVSSIWGRSDGPGVFQDEAEMKRNFIKWTRPEGRYPDRDGLYITVAPTRENPAAQG